MSWFELLLLFLTVMKSLPIEVVCNNLPDIYWNSSNPIFRIDNTDHIIDVNTGNTPFEYDQVNIICPVYSEDSGEEDTERCIIYNVSKEEYDTCRITNPSPRVIAVCDKPTKLMYFTITFRSFTPQPGGLEFHPGQDYYFISTSSQDDLHRRIGGRCSTNHMKVVFKVCCDAASQPAHDQANNHINDKDQSVTRGTMHTTTAKTTISNTTFQNMTPGKTTSHKNEDPKSKTKTNSKKTDTHRPDKKEKELAKNEELTRTSSSSVSLKSFFTELSTSLIFLWWLSGYLTDIPYKTPT